MFISLNNFSNIFPRFSLTYSYIDLLTISKSYFFLSSNFISSKILKYNI